MKSKSDIKNIIILSFIFSMFYAILRYNVFNEIPWVDLPIFILNKAVALTIILLLFYNQLNKKLTEISRNKLWISMFVLTIFHLILSTVILQPEYFGKFFDSTKLNIVGSLTILFGVLSFLGFFINWIISLNGKLNPAFSFDDLQIIKLKYFVYLFLGVHIFVLGINGWLTPSNWPGYLPPISLISFILLVSSIKLFSANDKKKTK